MRASRTIRSVLPRSIRKCWSLGNLSFRENLSADMGAKQILVVAFMAILVRAEIPSYIKICKANDPAINDCIKDSIHGLKDELAKGIPELEVPPIEPFHLEKVAFLHNANSNVTELDISGVSNYEILELKAEVDKTRFACVVNLPEVTFTGNYAVDLKILVAQIKGVGKITGKFTDAKVTLLLKAKKFEEGGKTFVKFDPVTVKLVLDKVQVHLHNLFDGQKAIGDATNDLINEDPKPFMDELTPSLEAALSETLTSTANKITMHYTYDELFPTS